MLEQIDAWLGEQSNRTEYRNSGSADAREPAGHGLLRVMAEQRHHKIHNRLSGFLHPFSIESATPKISETI